jgi:hypothetical protein
MKKILTLSLFFLSIGLHSQDITGSWFGAATIQGVKLRIVFHIEQVNDVHSATMDSPDQGVKGIPVNNVRYENDSLTLSINNIGFVYKGLVKEESIAGKVTQNGMELPMILTREEDNLKRPQEPMAPFPYISEEISFKNEGAGINLSGTLTLPSVEGKFPVVVLINGSGPQNRNSEILGHKPFLVLSDHLTKNGIAVLRYDERGVGKSEGNYGLSTSKDFAMDVSAAVAYLKTRKEINQDQIGLIGHSEGGMIAPMVAANKSNNISYMVLMAAPGLPIDELMLLQTQAVMKSSGLPEAQIQKNNSLNERAYALVKNAKTQALLNADLMQLFGSYYDQNVGITDDHNEVKIKFIKQQMQSLSSPWFQYFIKYNPQVNLAKVKCPVLALNGGEDLQVTPDENLEAIENALKTGANSSYEVRLLSGLNHLFQECNTCTIGEYAKIEQTLSPVLLNEVTAWIKSQVKE